MSTTEPSEMHRAQTLLAAIVMGQPDVIDAVRLYLLAVNWHERSEAACVKAWNAEPDGGDEPGSPWRVWTDTVLTPALEERARAMTGEQTALERLGQRIKLARKLGKG